MVPHSSTLAWKIPWTEEPGRLQSMGWLRVPHSPGDVSARFSGKGLPQIHTQGTPSSANTRKARPGEESAQKLRLPEHLCPGECEPRAACAFPRQLPFVTRGSPGSGPRSSQIT